MSTAAVAVPLDDPNFEDRCRAIRRRIVRLCASPSGGHLGGAMSLVEILTVLLGDALDTSATDPRHRDALILSKGHGALGLYAALCEFGVLEEKMLDGYGTDDGTLLAHPHRGVPGVEAAAGSLGHGLAVGVGYALADRLDGTDRRTFVITGDGELQEGSIWESAMSAGSLGLHQLTAIVDRNGLQITGRTDDVVGLEPLGERWRSFGWTVREVDGHEPSELLDALTTSDTGGRPTVVIARTIKGRGVAAVEGQARSHFATITPRQERRLLRDLEPEKSIR